MNTYAITLGAERDLDEIWDRIAQDNPPAADRLLDEFYGKFSILAAYPRIAVVRPDLAPHARSVPAGNYVILYRLVPNGVEIAMVVHGSRDIRAAFFDRLSHRSDRGTTTS